MTFKMAAPAKPTDLLDQCFLKVTFPNMASLVSKKEKNLFSVFKHTNPYKSLHGSISFAVNFCGFVIETTCI